MSEFLSDNEELRTPEDYYRAAKKIEEGVLLKCQRYQVYCQFDIFNQLKQIIPEEENQVRWKWLTDYNRHEAGYFREIYPESVDYNDVNYDISLPSCHSVYPEPMFEQSLPLDDSQNPLLNNDTPLEPNNLDPTTYAKYHVPKLVELDIATNMSLHISKYNDAAQSTAIPVEIPSSPPPACLEDFAPEFNSRLTSHIYEDKDLNPHGIFDSSNIPIECLREAPQNAFQSVPYLPLNKPSPSHQLGSGGLLGSGGFGSEYDNPLSVPFSSIGDSDHTTKLQPSIVVKQDQSQIIISDDAPAENIQPPTLHTPTRDTMQDQFQIVISDDAPAENIQPPTLHTPTRDAMQEAPSATNTAATSESTDQPHTYTYTNISPHQSSRRIATPVSPKKAAIIEKSHYCTIEPKIEPDTIQLSPSRSPIVTRSKSKSRGPGNTAPELLSEYYITQMQHMANASKYEFNDSAVVNTMHSIGQDESYIQIGNNIHDARYFDQDDIKKTLEILQSTQQPMCTKRPGRPMTSPSKRTKDCFSLNVAKRLSWIESGANESDPIIRKKFRAPKKASSRELAKYNHVLELNNVKKMQVCKPKEQE